MLSQANIGLYDSHLPVQLCATTSTGIDWHWLHLCGSAQERREKQGEVGAASGLVLAAQWKDKKEYKSRLKSLKSCYWLKETKDYSLLYGRLSQLVK